MAPVKTNYFVCTLGEAAQKGIERPYTNVNNLIRQQALKNPKLPAIGFFQTSKDDGALKIEPRILTFEDVQQGVSRTADLLSEKLNLKSWQAVGILADSSTEFLFTWLGFIHLGHPVLLIAPQCSATAVAHLCKVCEVHVLLADEKHETLAVNAADVNSDSSSTNLRIALLPFTESGDVYKLVAKTGSETTASTVSVGKGDVAYLHHTSGTSSGLPKPIPQTHHGAVGVLPALDGTNHATFTTTPLYHGGPADIFRAWTSHALIWLYPSRDIPVTASNIVQCLARANQCSSTSTIKYFTSVPYILQMMAEDSEGLKILKGMDLVGVGGAALPPDVGDRLVKERVNLVSRFGSAECGFLLSSHREYEQDDAWQFLRQADSVDQLHFESREGDLAELIVKSAWPHMAKRNREDGSYATADLFTQHPKIKNGWKYHSRADSQLTLITGKKFDPAPVEDAIAAASSNVSDVLIFGNGRSFPGALIFRSANARDLTDAELIDSIKTSVDRLNEDNQSHAKLTIDMLVPMHYQENPLEKSSKGTVLRKQAEETYAAEIENSYQHQQAEIASVADEQLPTAIVDIVSPFIAKNELSTLDPNSDLFAYGIDSIACVRIRHSLVSLLPADSKLPLTVVEDCGSISALTDLVKKLRHGHTAPQPQNQANEIPSLVRKYSRLDSMRPIEDIVNEDTTVIQAVGRTVLLSGPTGSLGAHVLLELLGSSVISHIYLLVRGATQKAARERVVKAITSRNLSLPEQFDSKVTILQCKIADPDLGLAFQDYTLLQETVDLVLHLAWSVNFLLPLRSFTVHLAGIRNLLNLCLSSTKRRPPRFVFCSSVASVSEYAKIDEISSNVPEQIVADTSACGQTGYALSKLTAELILARVATEVASLRHRITIVRVGQLSADTIHGVWNASEAYPQILASAKFTDRCLPDLGEEEKLTWLPVNVAARAFFESSLIDPVFMSNMPTEHVKHKLKQEYDPIKNLRQASSDASQHVGEHDKIDASAVQVLHLLNPESQPIFTDFLHALQASLGENEALTLKLVSASEWIGKLESLQSSNTTNSTEHSTSNVQSLLRLLPFWKKAYKTREPVSATKRTMKESKEADSGLTFDMHNSLANMPALTYWLGLNTDEGFSHDTRKSGTAEGDADLAPVNQLMHPGYIVKVWEWVQSNVLT